jgi:hypothetical protein
MACVVTTDVPLAARTARLPFVLLLISPLFEVIGLVAVFRNGSATAYQMISPALSVGSGIPSVLQGIRPRRCSTALQTASATPSLSMSGQGSSPGRAASSAAHCAASPGLPQVLTPRWAA